MKKTILRYGIYSAITICLLALAGWTFGKTLSYDNQEIIGYSGMIISLIFVFFGIQYYRDKENEGILSFSKAITIGLLISLMAALAFGILDLIYIKFINPDFMNEYYTYYVEEMKNTLSESEFKIELTKLEEQKELFSNPLINFVVMFLTVFIIGFIISLLSALILQRKPAKNL